MGLPPLTGSLAGTPLSQPQAELEKAHQEQVQQQRRVDSGQQAERAHGIGLTEEDEEATDRDADGRRVWEASSGKSASGPDDSSSEPAEVPRAKDPTGQRGSQLDVTG